MARGEVSTVRAASNMLGTAIDASFASGVALAALALSRKGFYKPTDDTGFEKPLATPPEAIAVITWGVWRGEGMGLVEAVS
jgi:3-oxoacyl-[acyl-carrier-protein] synthase II